MGRKTRKQRAMIVWPRFIQRCKGKPFVKVVPSLKRQEKINGEMPFLCYLLMFQVIKEEWVKNTYVSYRNEMLIAVRSTLGKGAADELQRISSTRTFKR